MGIIDDATNPTIPQIVELRSFIINPVDKTPIVSNRANVK